MTPRFAFLLLACLQAGTVLGAGGPIGIDQRLGYDNSGIWKRSNQTALLGLMVATDVAGALWEGGETRPGKTYWQSIDASLLGGASAAVLKEAFTRSRPNQGDDPKQWFQGKGHYSFPSGEVTVTSAIVTPFVLEYGHDHPEVYALEALPAYDAVARMKVWGHWQTDVLAGFAIGTASGYYAHRRDDPVFLSVLPHGFMVGLKKNW
jgi:membrane-associated phospholipid phosphatase